MPLFLLVIFLEIAFSQTTCSRNSKCSAQDAKCCAKLQSSTTGTCKTRCSGKTPFEIVFVPTTTTTTTLKPSTSTTTSTAAVPTQPPIVCSCPLNTATVGINYNSRYNYITSVVGSLPTGLNLNTDLCSIFGVPEVAGTYTFDVVCGSGTRCVINTNRRGDFVEKNAMTATCTIIVSN